MLDAIYRTVTATLKFVFEADFWLYVHWLNPGFSDAEEGPDRLGLINRILHNGGTVAIRDGRIDPQARVRELREFIYGWAKFRNLVRVVAGA